MRFFTQFTAKFFKKSVQNSTFLSRISLNVIIVVRKFGFCFVWNLFRITAWICCWQIVCRWCKRRPLIPRMVGLPLSLFWHLSQRLPDSAALTHQTYIVITRAVHSILHLHRTSDSNRICKSSAQTFTSSSTTQQPPYRATPAKTISTKYHL